LNPDVKAIWLQTQRVIDFTCKNMELAIFQELQFEMTSALKEEDDKKVKREQAELRQTRNELKNLKAEIKTFDGVQEMIGWWDADCVFYNEDILTSFNASIEEITKKIFAFEQQDRERQQLAKGQTYKKRLIHGVDVNKICTPHAIANLPTPENHRVIIVGGEPNRITNSCYMCHKPTFAEFQDLICTSCAAINQAACSLKTDLTGQVALVTGVRIKIGYQIGLKLLRCGATLVGTSRFPEIARKKYLAEADAKNWKNRLCLFGLDLRVLPMLVKFCQDVKQRWSRLDIVINCACQTIRRPPAYYQTLVDQEQALLRLNGDDKQQNKDDKSLANSPITSLWPLSSAGPSSSASSSSSSSTLSVLTTTTTTTTTTTGTAPPGWAARNTLVPVIPGDDDDKANRALFPRGKLGRDGEPLDLRSETTWNTNFSQIHYGEMVEAHLVNCMAPFTILSELSPLLRKKNPLTRKFVVNVTSPEGQFATPFLKKGYHPHTNMTKAALNMLTRTIAEDFRRDQVYVLSVDTGWVSDMRPLSAKPVRLPLTDQDGAARVLHPILTHNLIETHNHKITPEPPSGVLLCHFKIQDW
jgi:NAD(P)-dependent dehydrogenase (short-subunit alcohol dehydrogenase family)